MSSVTQFISYRWGLTYSGWLLVAFTHEKCKEYSWAPSYCPYLHLLIHRGHTEGSSSPAPTWLLLARFGNAKTTPEMAREELFMLSNLTAPEALSCCWAAFLDISGEWTLFLTHSGAASAVPGSAAVLLPWTLHGFAGHWLSLQGERTHCPCSSLTKDSRWEAGCWSALPHKLTVNKVKWFWKIQRPVSQPPEQAVRLHHKKTTNKIKANNGQELEKFRSPWGGGWEATGWYFLMVSFHDWPFPHHLAPSLLASYDLGGLSDIGLIQISSSIALSEALYGSGSHISLFCNWCGTAHTQTQKKQVFPGTPKASAVLQ